MIKNVRKTFVLPTKIHMMLQAIQESRALPNETQAIIYSIFETYGKITEGKDENPDR